MKEQVKRLGKKGKDEATKLEADTAARQAAEIAELEAREKRGASALDSIALADSLYSATLEGEKKHDKVCPDVCGPGRASRPLLCRS